jgi:hypothetical protein
MYPSATEGPYSCCDSNARPYSAQIRDTECSPYCLTANNLSSDIWKTGLEKCNTSIDDDSMYICNNPVCDIHGTICTKIPCKTEHCTPNGGNMYSTTDGTTDGPYSCCEGTKPYMAQNTYDAKCSPYCLTPEKLSDPTWKTRLDACNTVDDSMSAFSNSVCGVGGTICTKIPCRTEHCTPNGGNMYLTTDGTTVGPYSCCAGSKPYMAQNTYDEKCTPYCLKPDKFSDPTWNTRLAKCGTLDDSMDSMSAFSNSVCGIDGTICASDCNTISCEQGGRCNPDSGLCESDPSQEPPYFWENGFGYCNNNQPTKFWGCHNQMVCYSDNTCHQAPTQCDIDVEESNAQHKLIYNCKVVPIYECPSQKDEDGCTPNGGNMYSQPKGLRPMECCPGLTPYLWPESDGCEWICSDGAVHKDGYTDSAFGKINSCNTGPVGAGDPYFRPCIARGTNIPVPVMPNP